MSVFEQAREAVSTSFIESELAAPGAYWQDGEYWTLNPLRPDDSRVGSFSVNERGLWSDFAGSGDSEKGDLIDLIARRDGIKKKEAAEYIVKRCGGIVEERGAGNPSPSTAKSRERKKPAPVLPVPSERLRDLNKTVKRDWYTERYGNPVRGWKYHNASGAVLFCIVRYQKQSGDKSVIPFYYAEDGKWHQGNPYKHERPLYNLPALSEHAERPVLIVEGEKAADAAQEALGERYVVTTWPGGSKAIDKVDWSPLAERELTMWPDCDEPGRKASSAILNRLPQTVVLNVSGKPDGWDAADAVADGTELDHFIETCEKLPLPSSNTDEAGPPAATPGGAVEGTDAGPFVALGYSDSSHWFLLKSRRILYSVPNGGVARHFLELARLDWWAVRDMTTDQQNVKPGIATDFLVRLSERAGRYEPERIRGAGVWRERHDGESTIVINDGRRIVLPHGETVRYEEFISSYFYVSSDARFGDLSGKAATVAEGQALFDLFYAQEFANEAMTASALGWALISPFGGLLAWRPHIWITGRKGSGKTWVIENLIKPLCGPFAYHGSGKDSEAGIRRSLRTDARPVILDEMEPRTRKEQERIESKIELARNASSDASGYITLASRDGGVDRFSIRSCFCFASVQVPSQGAAIDSRFTRCEFRPVYDEKKKIARTKELLHAMDDPGRYRRRMFLMLPQIVSDIDYLREVLPKHMPSQRDADQIAPFMAAVWALTHDSSIRGDGERTAILSAIDDFQRLNEENVEDEDRMIHHLLQGRVRMDDGKMRTVGELLYLSEHGNKDEYAVEHLSRIGMRVLDYTLHGESKRVLAIATRSDAIAEYLRETPYQAGYDAQLRRNPFVVGRDTVQIRIASGRMRCRLLDWEKFYKAYIDSDFQEEFDYGKEGRTVPD